jgi:4-amino-4-deoxy-L-arabinose transferase-like glycosyltransferase
MPLRLWAILIPISFFSFFWNLSGSDVTDVNEGMRLVPGVQMLESGNWITPYIHDRPYIKKPPLTNWAIAASFELFDSRTPGIGRLSFALSGTLCALGVAWIGSIGRSGRWSAGFWAGLFVTTFYYLIHKAQKADIDSSFTLFVGAGVWLMGRVFFREGGRRNGVLLSGIAFGVASMYKGPVILLFWLAGLFTALIMRRNEWKRSLVSALMILGVALGLFLVWAVLLIDQLGWDHVRAVFRQESIDRISDATKINSEPFWFYFTALPGATMPWSPLLLVSIVAGLFRRPEEERAGANHWILRYSGWFILFSLILFSFVAGKEIEYLLPVFPFVALLVGRAMEWLCRKDRQPVMVDEAARWYFLALAAACCLAPVALIYSPLAPWILISKTSLPVLAVGLMVSAFAFVATLRRRPPAGYVLCVIAVALIIAGYRDLMKPRDGALRSAAPAVEYAASFQLRGWPVFRYRADRFNHAHAIWYMRSVAEALPTNPEEAVWVMDERAPLILVLRRKYVDDFENSFGEFFKVRVLLRDPRLTRGQANDYTVVLVEAKKPASPPDLAESPHP